MKEEGVLNHCSNSYKLGQPQSGQFLVKGRDPQFQTFFLRCSFCKMFWVRLRCNFWPLGLNEGPNWNLSVQLANEILGLLQSCASCKFVLWILFELVTNTYNFYHKWEFWWINYNYAKFYFSYMQHFMTNSNMDQSCWNISYSSCKMALSVASIPSYSLHFKIKITFGHKLHYEIKCMFGEISLKLAK